jgi:hypothetical protein
MFEAQQSGAQSWSRTWAIQNPHLTMTVEEIEFYAWLWRWRRTHPWLSPPGFPPVTLVDAQQIHVEARSVTRWQRPSW